MRKVQSVSICALAISVLVSACTSSSDAGDAGADAAGVAQDDAAMVADAATDVADGSTKGDGGSTRASWGYPCTVGDDTTCVDGLFCLEGPSGGTVGFCTKTCPKTSSTACVGTPAGTAAYCVVTDVDTQGDKGCAFVCRIGGQTDTCPGALKCQTTDDPAGSGTYLCLP